jgi:hypothetical protein
VQVEHRFSPRADDPNMRRSMVAGVDRHAQAIETQNRRHMIYPKRLGFSIEQKLWQPGRNAVPHH